VLTKKPGAFSQRRAVHALGLAKLKSHADGDRQFVKVRGAVPDHGLEAVEAACAETLLAGIASGDGILAAPARQGLNLCPV